MGFYNSCILPRVLDLAMQRKQMTAFREQIGKTARGTVVDVGIGSGLNLPFYGQAERVYGIDPSPELLQFAQARASRASVPVELMRGSGEALPLEDDCVDTAVLTFTLCTVEDVDGGRKARKPGAEV